MATADSVKAKIQGLIDTSNSTTGQNDTDLTSAINHLKEGYGQGGESTPLQEKTVEITKNGTSEVLPDNGYALSKVTVSVDVPIESDPLEGYFDGSLTEVNLPNVESIRAYGFYEPSSSYFDPFRLKKITMPNVKVIGEYAFYNCYELSLSELPSELEEIQQKAFANCFEIVISEIPKTVKVIGSSAFASCNSMTNLTFKGVPTSIANNALATTITTINVPWSEGEVANAPWGAKNATIIYDYGKEPEPPAEGDSRTWVFNDTITGSISANVNFTIGDLTERTQISGDGEWLTVWSPNGNIDGEMQYVIADGEWTDEKFKTITFTDDTYKDNATFYTWLQANATQQGSSGDDSGDTNTFTFTINGTTYTAVEGMTWEEWCASEYNTDGYSSEDMFLGYAYCVANRNNYTVVLYDDDYSSVNYEDTINENGSYTLWSE